MRLFGSDRLIKVMDRLGAEEGEVITHKMVTRAIEKAQKRVEMQNFSIRKHLLEYDDVMNKQREVIYTKRRKALMGKGEREDIEEMMDEFLDAQFEFHIDEKKPAEEWDIEGLNEMIMRTLMIDINSFGDDLYEMKPDDLRERIKTEALRIYDFKEQKVGREFLKEIEKGITLQVIDENWKDHLHQMDMLKEGINLRAYGQKDPLIEYKKEAYNMFVEMNDTINQKTLETLWKTDFVEVEPSRKGAPSRMMLVHRDATNMGFREGEETAIQKAGKQRGDKPQPVKVGVKVGRNDPCPCGSGKKYKKCCGRAA